MEKAYIVIDLKSFYASVECAERGLDPLNTHLVVADESRTDKTICLAVSPSLKALGISGRARLFEAKARIRGVNAMRLQKLGRSAFGRRSVLASELKADPSLELDMIVAPPRMALYMAYSRRIYNIYLCHVAPEDIFAYSVDEVFIDATPYLGPLGLSAHDFARLLIREVLQETGITATAGIGTNLYLAKVAMDIEAKHATADADGVRIAALTERSYREKLWDHRPITDFWRVGKGIAKRLESRGLFTMGDIARCSLGREGDFYNEDLLYRLFGVNAELLIDHAWGWEPTELADVKSYRPETKSLSAGQILPEPYPAPLGELVVREMADSLAMDLVRKGFVTDLLVLDVAYDIGNMGAQGRAYKGPVVRDAYDRQLPKPVHGSRRFSAFTASSEEMMAAVSELYNSLVDSELLVRRFAVSAGNLKDASETEEAWPRQLNLFDEPGEEALETRRSRERKVQETMLKLRDKYGRNAVLRGMNLKPGATARERNQQIGGHKARGGESL